MYRPNVAGIMMNDEGKILICERMLPVGAWQFPQGGIDEGENPLQAILRELKEEIGYVPEDYTIKDVKEGYRYDYPQEVLASVSAKRKKAYIGQEQTYFLCLLHNGVGDPVLDGREFCRFRWIFPSEFEIEWLPQFKRPVYVAVLRDFFGV